MAIVLVAGTHHTDGVDETAFNQERANLLLPLFQVDVDGAERELPLQGIRGTGPESGNNP